MDFKKFYEEWLEIADSLEAIECGQENVLGERRRFSIKAEELLAQSVELTEEFRNNFEEYQRSAEEQGCLYDFESLIAAYPKLDPVGYGGGLDIPSDDEE